jgi:hypothetical protein
MKYRVIGDSPAATVLAGVLAAEKQEVLWNPDIDGERRLKELKRRTEIRLSLPWGWVQTGNFRLSSSVSLKAGELGVVAGCTATLEGLGPAGAEKRIGGRNATALVLDIEPELCESLMAPGTNVVQGLSLLEAAEWDPGTVEVSNEQPWLILQTGAELGELIRCLKSRKLGVQEVDDLSPYRNALHIRSLLALPVALCHCTLGFFLSYPEGREIAVGVLEEGLRLFSHRSLPLGKLPVMDPGQLLQKLQKKPQEFDRARNLPDRAYGTALHPLLRGERKAARLANDRIVRMSAQTGIEPKWNWAVTQRLNRVLRVGFYRDPAQLYDALK